jgi:ankyrin repeat protein
VVKFLLDKGAEVNARDNLDGATALMWASRYNHLEVVKFLIDKGSDVNAKNRRELGYTALVYAYLGLTNDNYDVIKLLLDKGTNLRDRNMTEATASAYREILYGLKARGARK